MEAIYETFASWPVWLQMITITGISILGGILLSQLIFAIMRWNARRFDSFTLRAVNRRLRLPFSWFLPLLILTITANTWDVAERYFWYRKLAEILLYTAAAWLLLRVVSVLADGVRRQYDLEQEDNLDERKILTQLQYIQRIIAITVVVITAAFILLQFESVRELGAGILTSAGVAGIIIGFAAQKSIANLLAGFQIAFTQPIRLDDVVIVEGEWGRIEEITLTYVVVRIWDQRRLVVPLQFFNENSFQNWTRSTSELIGAVFLYTDYTLPVDAIREKVDEILEDHPRWDGRVKAVQVTDAKPDVMEVRILVSARDAGVTFDLRCEMRERLISFIQNEYPDSLPQSRVLLQKEKKKERNGRQQQDVEIDVSSPTPEDGKDELPEEERV